MSTVDADDLTWSSRGPRSLAPASPRELKGLIKDWRSGPGHPQRDGGDQRRVRRGDRRGDDRRDARQRRAQGAAQHGRSVQHRVLPVGAHHPAAGPRSPPRLRSRWRPAGCSGRCSPRPPRASGCWMRRSPGPSCCSSRLVAASWPSRFVGGGSDRRADLGPDRVGARGGAGLGRRDRTVRRGFGGVRGGSARCGAAPAHPCRDLLLRPARAWPPCSAVVGVSAGWFTLGLADDLGVELGAIVIGFSGLVLISSAVLARRRLGRIRRARLLSGGALVSGMSGAFFALDIGLARDIVVERRAHGERPRQAEARQGRRAGGLHLAGVAAACAGSRSRCWCWPAQSSSRTRRMRWA